MFEKPAKRDIDYALSVLMHEARRRVLDEKNRITSEASKHGALQSNRVVVAVADAADKVHAESLIQAKQILIDFIQRIGQPAEEVTAWARPHLENLSNAVLGVIPPNGFPHDHQRIITQYQAVFHQRVEGGLREIDIGYVSGAGFATDRHEVNGWSSMSGEILLDEPNPVAFKAEKSDVPKLADAVTLKPTFMGMSIDLSMVWKWLLRHWHRVRPG